MKAIGILPVFVGKMPAALGGAALMKSSLVTLAPGAGCRCPDAAVTKE